MIGCSSIAINMAFTKKLSKVVFVLLSSNGFPTSEAGISEAKYEAPPVAEAGGLRALIYGSSGVRSRVCEYLGLHQLCSPEIAHNISSRSGSSISRRGRGLRGQKVSLPEMRNLGLSPQSSVHDLSCPSEFHFRHICPFAPLPHGR